MLSKEDLLTIKSQLQRIFAMKVSRSTYREIQNLVINTCQSNKILANQTLLSLLTREIQPEVIDESCTQDMEDLILEFSSKISLAKEIQEKGDFINIITSDFMGSLDNSAFLNRIRRIDGEEYHFITDLESTLRVVTHFLNRVLEFKQNPKNKELVEKQKGNLSIAKTLVQEILDQSPLKSEAN